MTTRILLIRHGDSLHRVDKVVGGPQGCRGLTPLGRQQAMRLRDRLRRERGEGTVHLYCSTVPRAIETARIVAEALPGVSPTQERGLCSYLIPPDVDGIPDAEYFARYAQAGGGVFRPFETITESWAELVARVGRALTDIAQRHQGQTVYVVGHGQTIGASWAVFGLLPLLRPFDAQTDPTGITEWTTEGDTLAWPPARWTLARSNDTAHLQP